MKLIATLAFAVVLATAGIGSASAQTAADAPAPVPPPAAQPQAPAPAEEPAAEQAEGVDQGEDPNWPGGLESWDSDRPEPQNVDPQAAERLGLTDPDVQRTLPPDPTPQGTRPPEPIPDEQAQEETTIYGLLAQVRRAPPGLDDQPIPRPNPLGSEPTTEMQPVGGPNHLFPEGYVE